MKPSQELWGSHLLNTVQAGCINGAEDRGASAGWRQGAPWLLLTRGLSRWQCAGSAPGGRKARRREPEACLSVAVSTGLPAP